MQITNRFLPQALIALLEINPLNIYCLLRLQSSYKRYRAKVLIPLLLKTFCCQFLLEICIAFCFLQTYLLLIIVFSTRDSRIPLRTHFYFWIVSFETWLIRLPACRPHEYSRGRKFAHLRVLRAQ